MVPWCSYGRPVATISSGEVEYHVGRDSRDRGWAFERDGGWIRIHSVRFQLKCDGTRWRTGGEVKGKLANGVGSQYPSLPRNLVYPALLPLMCTPRLPVIDWTDAPADLNGLVPFAERQNLVSARVPSHFKRSLPQTFVVTISRKGDLKVVDSSGISLHIFLSMKLL